MATTNDNAIPAKEFKQMARLFERVVKKIPALSDITQIFSKKGSSLDSALTAAFARLDSCDSASVIRAIKPKELHVILPYVFNSNKTPIEIQKAIIQKISTPFGLRRIFSSYHLLIN